MHIAICDDNVADRKQLERLLGRESDARKEKTGVFYTDSYGQGDKLYSSRMSYDLFFIDVTTGDETGFFLANRLHKGGVTVPIVLCSSKIDYREEALKLSELPENFLFLNKPILRAQLAEVLDEAVDAVKSRVPTIELRDRNETFYVPEDDIVYAETEGEYLKVHIKDGRIASMYQDASTFYVNIAMFTHFAQVSVKAVVNVTYVKKATPLKLILENDREIRISPIGYAMYKKALSRIEAEKRKKENGEKFGYE